MSGLESQTFSEKILTTTFSVLKIHEDKYICELLKSHEQRKAMKSITFT